MKAFLVRLAGLFLLSLTLGFLTHAAEAREVFRARSAVNGTDVVLSMTWLGDLKLSTGNESVLVKEWEKNSGVFTYSPRMQGEKFSKALIIGDSSTIAKRVRATVAWGQTWLSDRVFQDISTLDQRGLCPAAGVAGIYFEYAEANSIEETRTAVRGVDCLLK